jgi:ATP-binding cassette subfamily B protein
VTELSGIAWSRSQAAQAILALARAAGLPMKRRQVSGSPGPGSTQDEGPSEGASVEGVAAGLGLEAEAVGAVYADIDAVLAAAGPALLQVQDRFVALVGARGRSLAVVGPDGVARSVPKAALRDAICGQLEETLATEIDATLNAARVPARRRARARRALLGERLAGWRIEVGFILRPAPGAPASAHVRWSRLVRRAGVLVLAHGLEYTLGILGWWLVGRGALDGRLDRGWLLAWGLVLFSQVPFRLLATWSQGLVGVQAGALLKQRLLVGATQLDPDQIRTQGAGQLLGRIFESEAVESLALNAGLLGVVAVLELVFAGVILGLGAGGLLHVSLLATTVATTAALGWQASRSREAWTYARLSMTHDLVERMAGHRTRLTQQRPERWHDGEDQALDRYFGIASRMDGQAVRLVALMPRGWIVVGLVGIVPAFAGGAATTASLAVALGGVLLAYRALRKLVAGVSSLAGALIAWRQIAPLFHAAARAESRLWHDGQRAERPAAKSGPRGSEPSVQRPILEASEIVFRYRDRGEAVLRGCTLRIHPGDRLLLEGSSGGGKSTFGAILAGLREPESGLLLVDGLDHKTLGPDAWRRRVVAAPQFHENHVFSSTFAFNLLMGRAWPPSSQDLALAEEVCRELDLGALLARMPAGLQQMVGETGWQLSHGEKGRLYVARAILQGGDVMVLDESFAALDPHTLQRALDCVRGRANALLVIAHP